MIGEQIIKRTKIQPTQKKKKGVFKSLFTITRGGEKAFFCFQAAGQKFYQFPCCYQKNVCTADKKKFLLYQTILSIK